MKTHHKRWLISMLKTSGSKREHVRNGRYAEDRHRQDHLELEDLPYHERIKSTKKFYNGKINLGPLARFLRGQAGNNWNEVYSEIIDRIPSRLMEYRKCIWWFVADKVEFVDGRPWNKSSQKFIWTGGMVGPLYANEIPLHPEFIEFYVHPDTNQLIHIPQKAFKRVHRKKS